MEKIDNRKIKSGFKSSSSSSHATSMDLSDPLSSPVPIVHCSREVSKVISSIGTELLLIGYCRSSCLCASMWRGPPEYVAYEYVFNSPVVSRMSGSSNFDRFRDGW